MAITFSTKFNQLLNLILHSDDLYKKGFVSPIKILKILKFQVLKLPLFLFLQELSEGHLRKYIKPLLFEMGIKDKSCLHF
jgi:hypothetical protein